MRNLILTAGMLLTCYSHTYAQKAFKINGVITGTPKDTVLFAYEGADGKYLHTKHVISGGKFIINGHIDGPASASISFKNGASKQIFIEPAEMSITVDPEHLSDLKMTGSKTQQDQDDYDAMLKPINEKSGVVYKAIKLETDPDKKKALRAEADAYSTMTTNTTYRFFASHPHSYVTEYLLLFYSAMMDFDSTKKVYNALTPALKQNTTGKRLGEQIKSIDATTAGNTAPDFNTTDVDGKALSLSDFKGKFVLLDFWGSWCVPCRKSHPHLRAIYARYKPQGLEIIGIADDEPRPDVWRTAIKQDSIGMWHHILDGADQAKQMKGEKNPKDIVAKYGITAFPTKFLIGPDGKILAKVIGDDISEIDDQLSKAFAQATFTLTGKTGNLNQPNMAYLLYNNDGKTQIDSTILVNGKFNFKGTLEGPEEANIVISNNGNPFQHNPGKRDRITFYLEPGNQALTATDSIANATVIGSALNAEYQDYKTALKPVYAKFNQLNADYQSASADTKKSEIFRKEMDDKEAVIDNEKKSVQLSFIKSHPGSLVSLDALKDIAGAVTMVEEIQPVYNTLAPVVKDSYAGKKYGEYLSKLALTAIGQPAPEIQQPDTAGVIVKLSSFRGKYVLVDFWASWCGPCRAENPNLRRDYATFHPKGFEVLGVSLDQPDGKAKWIKAIQDDQLTWTQVSDLKYWKSDVADIYGVRAIPQNFLISPDGKIVAKNLRGDVLTKKLTEIYPD
jgi:peroxiredoxin